MTAYADGASGWWPETPHDAPTPASMVAPQGDIYIDEPGEMVDLGGDLSGTWAVRSDGTRWPWLLRLDHDHPEGTARCCLPAEPAHERLGPLPAAWRSAVSRCQARTHDGHQCRRPTRTPRDLTCTQHRDR